MKNLYTLLIFIIISINANSQDFNTELLPELISPSNSGTEFAISLVPAYYSGLDDYNVVRFFVSSSTNTKVRFRLGKVFFDTTINVAANKVSEYNIHAKYIMPFNKTPNGTTPFENIYENKALLISAESPVIIYVLVRLKTYTEGFLALPLNFLSSEYNISTFNDYTNNKSSYSPSTTVVVSTNDNSRVTFRLGGNSTTRVKLENGDSLFPSYTVRRTLNKGDVWVIPGFGVNNDLSGSTIRSTKPVAVYTGNFCAQVALGQLPCEYLIEQEIPIFNFSKRYYITPIFGRTSGSWVKINSYDIDTEVLVNGTSKGKIAFPYGVEGEGFMSFRVNTDSKPAIISSDKRINVIQYNTGNENANDKGIPFKMQALSSDNFSKKIVFHLPATSNFQFFTENYVNIIFKLDENGQIPNDLILSEINENGTVVKTVKELAVNNPVPFPVAETDGSRMYCLTLSLAKYGRFILSSSKPVGAVFYGKVVEDTYGSPAYIYLKNNDKLEDNLPPNIIYTETGIANFTGTITDEPETNSKVRSNLSMVHLISDSSYNFQLSFDEFLYGVDYKSSFELRPISIKDNGVAYLRAVDGAGNDTIIRFFYSNVPTPPKITLKSFTSNEFCPGDQVNLEYTITNGSFLGENTFKVKLGKKNPDKPIYPIALTQVNGSLITKINFNIPRNLISGDDYYIFIETTYPPVKSDSIEISLFELPQLSINGFQKVSVNNTYKYYTSKSSAQLKWTVSGGTIVGADNLDTVSINWTNKGNNSLSLTISNDKCSEIVEYPVTVGDDYFNEIEGVNKVCKNDSLFYNSFLSVGTFNWSIIGGKIIGDPHQQLIRVFWQVPGNGSLRLIYTDENGIIKDIIYDVQVADLPPKPTITRENKVLISSAASGNQWFFEGNIISGARAKTYDTKDIEGKYTVQITAAACKSEFSDVFNYSIAGIVYKTDSNILKIFPNPVTDNLHIIINSKNSGSAKITIFDYKMSIVDVIYLKDKSDDLISLDYSTEKLSSGNYYLRFDSGNDYYYDKFIISK